MLEQNNWKNFRCYLWNKELCFFLFIKLVYLKDVPEDSVPWNWDVVVSWYVVSYYAIYLKCSPLSRISLGFLTILEWREGIKSFLGFPLHKLFQSTSIFQWWSDKTVLSRQTGWKALIIYSNEMKVSSLWC